MRGRIRFRRLGPIAADVWMVCLMPFVVAWGVAAFLARILLWVWQQGGRGGERAKRLGEWLEWQALGALFPFILAALAKDWAERHLQRLLDRWWPSAGARLYSFSLSGSGYLLGRDLEGKLTGDARLRRNAGYRALALRSQNPELIEHLLLDLDLPDIPVLLDMLCGHVPRRALDILEARPELVGFVGAESLGAALADDREAVRRRALRLLPDARRPSGRPLRAR